jgi:tetratricopeptide (TPR) repeat protein
VSCPPLAAAQSVDRWVSARTEHFTIVSHADERSVRRLAANLEQFVTVASRLLGADAVPGTPVTVLAFRDDKAFRPFKPLYNGKPSNISGFFLHDPDETVIALDISAAREHHPFSVIYHEYTHLLTNVIGRHWPAWVREGLAEFYSTFRPEGDRITLGIPIADHVRLLREGRLIRLPQLVEVDHRSEIYNEGDRQSLFYAESWALVHYLLLRSDPRRPSQLQQFLGAMAEGQAPEQAFESTVGTPYSSLEAELRGYVSRRVYPVVSYPLQAPLLPSEIDIRPLSRTESELQLGRLLLHTDRLDEAEAFFRRAHGFDPGAPGPYESLGLLALRRAEPDLAIEHLAQAVSRDSRSHLARYVYADAMYRQAPNGRVSADQVKAILEQARMAAMLEPRFLPARHLMARVYLTLASEADVSEGARMMADARAAFPLDARIALTLGNLQSQLGDYESARSNLFAVTDAADETLKDQARYLLTQIEAAAQVQTLRMPPTPLSAPPAAR